jgi:hypothetical protein
LNRSVDGCRRDGRGDATKGSLSTPKLKPMMKSPKQSFSLISIPFSI